MNPVMNPAASTALGPLPPFPPEPPFPPGPPRTPWQPESRPPAPGPVSASASLVVGGDWLAERLLDRRVVALSGELDAEAVNRAVGSLALLDADGEEPVQLRLSGVTADLDAALTLIDALDLMTAPVHATALGVLAGPAVAILAVAERRTAGPHATFHLCEPRTPRGMSGREVEALADQQSRQLRRLAERLAEACRRPVDEIAADVHQGAVLDVDEAKDYGLLD